MSKVKRILKFILKIIMLTFLAMFDYTHVKEELDDFKKYNSRIIKILVKAIT
ncbi:hypothetical protein [Staphylococcus kloosii]|uniref:hypothetical protein n=1 Tax=Staphylococcus kloosii TaxID=29384 RepID=UPI0028A5314C|nr:hypothetical protein [Staphylococcus kloosii]MDT3959576.1 hypothetical protein [Staphylococcus kloosii]